MAGETIPYGYRQDRISFPASVVRLTAARQRRKLAKVRHVISEWPDLKLRVAGSSQRLPA